MRSRRKTFLRTLTESGTVRIAGDLCAAAYRDLHGNDARMRRSNRGRLRESRQIKERMDQRRGYDLCVVGAGSAGYAAATTARSLGRSVIIAESHAPLGGLCILRGCMPSKTLL